MRAWEEKGNQVETTAVIHSRLHGTKGVTQEKGLGSGCVSVKDQLDLLVWKGSVLVCCVAITKYRKRGDL